MSFDPSAVVGGSSSVRRMEIVVGVDGSAGSHHALAWAADEARRRSSSLRVVMAWELPFYAMTGLVNAPPEDALRQAAASAFELAMQEAAQSVDLTGIDVVTALEHGTAAGVLIDASASAELVVVGSRGRGALTGALLGSVGRAVVSHARCPVVVVPEPD